MKIKFGVLLVLMGICKCFACKCQEYPLEENIKIGLEKADLIFYGELIKLDSVNDSYTFKIFEIFKGNYKSKLITSESISNCDFYFREKGLCIIYGNFNRDKTFIRISACSPSQSQNFGPGFPPIPFKFDTKGKIITKNEVEMNLFYLENKNKSLQSFIYQLEKLRQFKLFQRTHKRSFIDNIKDKITLISIIVNVLFLLTIIFLIVSKKTSNNRITK